MARNNFHITPENFSFDSFLILYYNKDFEFKLLSLAINSGKLS